MESCPICQKKLKKKGIFLSCFQPFNHWYQIHISNDEIDELFLSLGSYNSLAIRMNHYKNITKLYANKDGSSLEFELPYILELDFPDLEKVKELVKMCIHYT